MFGCGCCVATCPRCGGAGVVPSYPRPWWWQQPVIVNPVPVIHHPVPLVPGFRVSGGTALDVSVARR
jgi:hypothetical protein